MKSENNALMKHNSYKDNTVYLNKDATSIKILKWETVYINYYNYDG